MRRTALIIALAGGAVLLACQENPAAPADTPRLAVTTQESTDLTGTVLTNPCTGEPIVVEGRVHLVERVTHDAAGGAHLGTHVNTQDLRGIGATGTMYRFVSGTDFETNFTPGSAVETTKATTSNVISQGATENFVLQMLVHTTIDANGRVTSSVTQVSTHGCTAVEL